MILFVVIFVLIVLHTQCPTSVAKMAAQFDLSSEEIKRLQEKAKRRATLRAEFLKQATNPFRHASGEGGSVFDPAIQRFSSLRVTTFEHFRANALNSRIGFLLLIAPMAAFGYLVKTTRDKQEAKYRRGEVAYKDRLFKYI